MFFNILEIIIAGFLILVILLQMQGSGISGAFGGKGEFYRSKRSVEKLLIWMTIILATLFGVLSIILLVPH